MTAFRKKPVVIEAVQLHGTEAAFQAAIAFLGGASGAFNGHLAVSDPDRSWLYIDTLEGQMTAHTGDWIIRGVKGEHYPCKPDIFALTYEAADALAEPAKGVTDEAVERAVKVWFETDSAREWNDLWSPEDRQVHWNQRMRAALAASGLAECVEDAHGYLQELTGALEEHPEGYEGPCWCKTCSSYGD